MLTRLFYGEPIFRPQVPGVDLRGETWFDADSDGPYDLAAIEKMIADRPQLAREFHVTGELLLSYEVLLPERLTALFSRETR